MSFQLIEVKNRHDLKKFIYLPAMIHKGHKNWVPPIYMDERFFFNPRKNRSFTYCDTLLLLAIKDSKPAGRIMGVINHKYNEAHKEKDGRFCFMETYNDPEMADALLKAVEDWALSKNMTRMVGPLGFSDKDPQGMLIEGFDQPMVIATNCNFPYQVTLLENAGYTKHTDLVVYKLDVPDEIPEFYKRIYERGIQNNNITILNFMSRRQLKPYIKPVLHLLNQTFMDVYAFLPLDEQEMEDYASRYLSILNPRFIKVVTNYKDEVVAFIIGMPDVSEGIKSCGGHIFPFGLFKILYCQKRTKQLNLLLGGIREDYRNMGINAVMGVKMIEEAHKAGLKYVDSHLELETNTRMRAEMERLNGKVYKKYRIYRKALA